MEQIDIKTFYRTNENFKKYVDKYCNEWKIGVSEALTHELVRQVYLYYLLG